MVVSLAPIITLLLCLILSQPTYGKSRRQKTDTMWKNRKRECEREQDLCGGIHVDLNQNCVNECISPDCYTEVYGPSTIGPLEDGEIDPERQKLFTQCVRRDYREQKRKREMA
eukprot:CAMPEP_0118658032 /NCGR_PEP_ID=MMETSP0785-20121206/14345_1 /TAXON_ID=91992 /ORGANISM="Bolidomonas pacifica, Strain CCMP 1866" /LENGTH=112 /DNA_ID=CAMNT_0006551009 /DNA_START=93 /DNA_END=427 /DNA_ORIENTATION=+